MMSRLATYLHAVGHKIAVIAYTTPNPTKDEAFDTTHPYPIYRVGCTPGVKSGVLRALTRARNRLRYLAQVRAVARQHGTHIILCAEWQPCGLFAYLLSRLPGFPPYAVVAFGVEVVTLPSVNAQKRTNPLWRGLMASLRRAIYRRAAGVVAISQYTKDKVVGAGVPAEHVTIIPPGIDASDIKSQDAIQAEPDDRPTLITVGRMVQRKGYDVVLRALAQTPLLQKHPHLQYVIAGDGPEKPRIEAMIRDLGLQAHVVLRGQVSEAEKWALYDAALLFVMPVHERPTNFEGFGIVYLEAMARFVPVIGSATGGIPDAISDGQTGLLVPPDDPSALADAIDKLLSDAALRSQLVTNAYERVRTTFTWEVIAARFADQLASYSRNKRQ
jgi:phosphatidylinositol alpha-1,6-mannosyltransferase